MLHLLPVRLLPESPRWLVAQGRHQQALKVMHWAAKVNRKQLPADRLVLDAMKNVERQVSHIVIIRIVPVTTFFFFLFFLLMGQTPFRW